MTVKQYIAECELYPYSRECFELRKECAELGLMERTLAAHEFMESHESDLEGIHFTESYFMESITDEEYHVLLEEAEKKKEGIFTRIRNALKRAVDAIKAYYKKYKSRHTELGSRAVEVGKRLEKAGELSAEDVDALLAKLDSALEAVSPDAASTFTLAQPYSPKVKINASVDQDKKNKATWLLAVLFSDTKIALNIDKLKPICSSEVLLNSMDEIAKLTNRNAFADNMGMTKRFKKANDAVNESIAKVGNSKKIVMGADVNSIDGSLKALEQISSVLNKQDQINQEVISLNKAAGDPRFEGISNAMGYEQVPVEYIKNIQAVTSNLIKLCSMYTEFRKKGLNAVSEFLIARSKKG